MTERFKQAVKDCVADAVLTDAEKELLKKIANEEGINETDAEVYIIKQLKIAKINEKYADQKARERENKPKSTSDGSVIKHVVEGILGVGTLVVSVLSMMGKNNQQGKK